jgi:copper chaperone CopZ
VCAEESYMKQLKLEVTGMSCGHCVGAVREALAAVPGVKVDNVSIGSVSVSFDETRTTVGDLVDAVADAGYEATEAA